jgi:hypothetical protein
MALFLLENRDFLGFRMMFKVPLNQIFSNFHSSPTFYGKIALTG